MDGDRPVDDPGSAAADRAPDGGADDVDAGRVARVADALAGAETAAALTGAGVSAASGVPTFRGEDGVWETEFDPADFEYGRFRRDPAGFWRDRIDLHDALFGDDPEPNAAHDALVRLEALGALDAVLTQNTDGLHAAAGSERVVELHGSARRVACEACGARYDAGPVRERAAAGELPPRCECGGPLKPDVVLFGEALPQERLAEARRLARDADVFLAVGSSLTVEPAASLPRTASRSGRLVVVNLDPTDVDGLADAVFRADVTAVLPALAEAVAERVD
ncbi:MAG: NAD-dependent protein deacylase [Haloferacaceae archaeon]